MKAVEKFDHTKGLNSQLMQPQLDSSSRNHHAIYGPNTFTIRIPVHMV